MVDAAKPVITVIIPTYRRPKLLRRAIQSILNQTYPRFQVCVYDNASGDETAEVVAQFSRVDPRVKYHRHVENIGALNNFNFALNAVKTPFFSFLSDDDVVFPEFFQTVMGGFEKYPQAAFSAGATIAMAESGKVQGVALWPSGYFTPPEGLLKMVVTNLTWTSIVFRKEVVDEVGGLDLEVGAPSDLDFLFRVAARFPFVTSERPAAIWVAHPGSICSMVDSSFLWPGQLKLIRNLTEDRALPLHVRTRVGSVLTTQLKQGLFRIGVHSIIVKNYDDAYRVAKVLERNYSQTAKANLIFAIAWCCDNLPLTHSLLSLTNRVRKISRWKREGNLQKRFGKYSRFLN
jgi:glycosyltransferase involved in cell wall biosynthesis